MMPCFGVRDCRLLAVTTSISGSPFSSPSDHSYSSVCVFELSPLALGDVSLYPYVLLLKLGPSPDLVMN
jgi:hypothetical protein